MKMKACPAQAGHLFRIEPSDEDLYLTPAHRSNDGRDIGSFLPLAQNHLGKTLTERSVMIDFRKTEIFEWQMA